jgi:hypothetical protein
MVLRRWADQAGAAALPELLHEMILGLGIQGAGGFIQDEEHRVGPALGQCPGVAVVRR